MNALVGKEFVVGSVRLRGVELCEPCMGVGKAMATESVTPSAVIKYMVHRGGLRADVLTSGTIAAGALVSEAG